MRAFQLKAQRNITIVDLDDDNEENDNKADGDKNENKTEADTKSAESEEKSENTATAIENSPKKKVTEEPEKMSVDSTEDATKTDVEKKTPEKEDKSNKVIAEDVEMEDESKAKTGENKSVDTSTSKEDEQEVVSTKSTDDKNIKLPEPTLFELLNWLDNPPEDITFVSEFCITLEDFCEAVKVVQPSAKREGFITVPDVTWDDVGSLQDIREELKLAVLAPVKFPEKMARLGLSAPSGVLLCGPPGCGKTLLAKAIANEAGINFISVKGPELMNMV